MLFGCVKSHQPAVLLESVEGPQSKSRFSVVGWGASQYLRIKDGKVEGSLSYTTSDPLHSLREMLRKSKRYNFPSRFQGGIIGYVSYDAVKYFEKLRTFRPEAESWPDFEFFSPENLVVYDHLNGKVYIGGDLPTECRSEETRVEFSGPLNESLRDSDYVEGVNKILEYIRQGYTFQTVLSKFYRFQYEGDLLKFYENLRRINPSPYMYYLKFWDREIIGSSPETLFRVESEVVETFPIAGTRPRGRDENEDLRLEQELLESEKERAEHLMLVDLGRNDLGKICKLGTVKVPEFMYVEKYSHVQHIVSRIVGSLHHRFDSFDVLRATFPAGTVSGAPKPMSMNIIEEIEPYKRGPYAGAVGYFSVNGNAEFAISIRTAFANNGIVRLQAGAGIVYDSIPEMEVKEVKQKLAALRVAMGDIKWT